MAPQQVHDRVYHLLPLKDNGAPSIDGDTAYIYLPPPTDPPYSIRFEIDGTSSICRQGSLWVNIPAKGEQFGRNRFREFKLNPSFNHTIKIDIPIHVAGAFSYYCTYTPLPPFTTLATEPVLPTKTQLYYIDIAPGLHIQKQRLPLDAISIISVLSKFMGQYPIDWDNHLHGISERGYNMVHFTPLMARGVSNSPYSIFDQHTFDQTIFAKGEVDVTELVSKMEADHGLLGLTDVVWNHTANNSKWLEEHPEAAYNINTAPHLRSAFELDTALLNFSNTLRTLGLPTSLADEKDLIRIMDGIKVHVFGQLRLWEFYVCDVKRDTQAAVEAWIGGNFSSAGAGTINVQTCTLKERADWLRANACPGKDRMGERFRRQILPDRAAWLLHQIFDAQDRTLEDRKAQATAVHDVMQKLLDEVNLEWYREYDLDVEAILEQIFNRTKYMRLDNDGPRIGDITAEQPLIESYFTRLPLNETTRKHDPDSLALANNGWVWAADVLRDNAGPESKVYLRRELIVWGDCVKLRYGSGPEDSPYLWNFMEDYTRLMAKHFHGFRIDNCHSTPLHVAEYMLDAGRQVRPNLVVAAELFSGDEKMDFLYCQRLGISFLIREAMQCWSTAELSRIVHINCGRPIGSFEVDDVSGTDTKSQVNGARNGVPQGREIVHKVIPSKIHALLMDCTHDNETPVQRRDGRDTLPSAALVAMCASASGSVFGMDELYPQLIDLVHETRSYTSPYSRSDHTKLKIGPSDGIGGIKKLMNQLHTIMAKDGYEESFVHHDGEYITVHRMHPKSRKGYYLIAHTAFPGYGNGNAGLKPQRLSGTRAKLLGAWHLECDQSEEAKHSAINDKVLRGIPAKTRGLEGVSCEYTDDMTVIAVPEKFPPGSIAVFETWIPGAEHSEGLDKFVTSGAREAFKGLNLVDLNAFLYRADAEERASSDGKDGSYTIPGHGSLVYCGLQGWWSVLRDVITRNDLGHPIASHLRDGPWPMHYIVSRLEKLATQEIYTNLKEPASWLKQRFDAIGKVPNFLLPRYFALVVRTAYQAGFDRAIEQMDPDIREGQSFVKELALVSIQMQGYMGNASLWPNKLVPSLAAGLPHFAQDWARCWGRDTMIAMRGLLLCTGRFEEAREHILCFASLVKHGMIPNLLGSGKLPRYNSRDSVWFFLQVIQDYVTIRSDGISLLREKVKRRFLPYDDQWFPWDDVRAYSSETTVEDVIHECLQRHAGGLDFREYNAGPNLDSQMKSEGFDIRVEVDWATGIIFGGNESNCGTWMDKMGESAKAGNQGHPGTSRDGAPIEITGLLFSTLRWIESLRTEGNFKHEGVKNQLGEFVSYASWSARLRENFERCYYIPATPKEYAGYDLDPKLVNRNGIYKDVYKCSKQYRDYQLRPNFAIAMTVAPELFDPEHALTAIEMADNIIRGPTGMATLDPSDQEYRPNYINSDDSDDYQVAKGRNYHQGPEWLWPTGFFLRAMLEFDMRRRDTREGMVETFQQITQRLSGCKHMIRESPWAGLTELTNQNGSECKDSCPTQAWSAGCIIDLFKDASKYSDRLLA